MGRVLYEISYEFNFLLLVPVVLTVIFPFVPKLQERRYEKYDWMNKPSAAGQKALKGLAKAISAIGFFFALLFTIIIVISEISTYKSTVGAYKSGDYEVVEGYVENFVPMTYGSIVPESFEIDGVEFSYPNVLGADMYESGYDTPRHRGGVIEGDGQHLKIGYIRYDDRNLIVYIEQLD